MVDMANKDKGEYNKDGVPDVRADARVEACVDALRDENVVVASDACLCKMGKDCLCQT